MSTDKPVLNMNVNVRPIRDEDEPFIRQLKDEANSERLLLDQTTLDEERKKLLLDLNYEGHKRHYQNVDWEKTECIIEIEGEPAGFYIVMQDKEEIRLADIVISGQYRGIGLGFAIIQSTQAEAAQSERALRLHVEKMSPALPFYEKLGFQLLEDRATHLFLEWLPPNMQGKKTLLSRAVGKTR